MELLRLQYKDKAGDIPRDMRKKKVKAVKTHKMSKTRLPTPPPPHLREIYLQNKWTKDVSQNKKGIRFYKKYEIFFSILLCNVKPNTNWKIGKNLTFLFFLEYSQ